MSLLKRAAVRGINFELTRRGLVAWPTKEAMDEVSDAVADGAPGLPDAAPPEGHDPEQILEVAMKLREISDKLMQEAQAGGGGAPGGEPGGAPGGMPPEMAAQGAAELGKQAAATDLESAAYYDVGTALDKIAAETGALVAPGKDHKNTPEEAAKHDTVAAMDDKDRPQGAHLKPRGTTDLPSRQDHIGGLKPNPKQPSNSPGGSNSVSEDAHKTSAEMARKIANALVGQPGAHENTAAAAAQHDTVAKLDEKNRPAGYALVGQGNTNFSEPQAARVGTEQPHPAAPTKIPGTNSVQEASKAGSYDEAFVALFSKTSEEVGSSLPASLTPEMKTAAIRHMIGLDATERVAYVEALTKQAKDKCDEDEKAKKDKDGEKKDKPAEDLMARIHGIANPKQK